MCGGGGGEYVCVCVRGWRGRGEREGGEGGEREGGGGWEGLLGVTPHLVDPGNEGTILVRPHIHKITWAEITIPSHETYMGLPTTPPNLPSWKRSSSIQYCS